MELCDIDNDILIFIYKLLHIDEKMAFVEAIIRLQKYSQFIQFLKHVPTPIITSALFPTEYALDNRYGFGNFRKKLLWHLEIGSFRSWISLFRLRQVFELPISFDITFLMVNDENTQYIEAILPFLDFLKVRYFNLSYFRYNDTIPSVLALITRHLAQRQNHRPSLKWGFSGSDIDFKLVPEYPLEQFIGYRASQYSQKNYTLLTISNFIKHSFEGNLTNLAILYENMHKGLLDFNCINKLILHYRQTLTSLMIACYSASHGNDQFIETIMQVPNLQRLETTFPLPYGKLKESPIQDLSLGGYCSLYPHNSFTELKISLDTKRLKRLYLGSKIPSETINKFPDLLECLGIYQINREQLILPPYLRILYLERFLGKELPIFPLCLEELYLDDYFTRSQPNFLQYIRLHTLQMRILHMEGFDAWPPNLRCLVDVGSRSYCLPPRLPPPTFNQGLQSLTIWYGENTNWEMPSTLQEFELVFKDNDKIDTPYEIPKIEKSLIKFSLRASRYIIDPGLNFICSNLKYLSLDVNVTLSRRCPFLLPSSLEILHLSNVRCEYLHLQFPSNCATNLQVLDIHGPHPIKYSYLSIGHGKRGTSHNNLKVIRAEYLPDCDFDFDFKKIKNIFSFVRENKTDLERKIFSSNAPENLMEVHGLYVVFINPNLRNRKRESEVSNFEELYSMRKRHKK